MVPQSVRPGGIPIKQARAGHHGDHQRQLHHSKGQHHILRDQKVVATLSDKGWRIAIVWECVLKEQADVHRAVDQLKDLILDGGGFIEIGEKEPRS